MSDHPNEIDATTENFPQILEQTFATPVLIEFSSDSCEPCQTLSPLLTSLADQYEGRFFLARVNVDQQPSLAMQFGVENPPSVKLIKDGRIIAEFTEVLAEAAIRSILDEHLQSPEDKRIGEARQMFENGEQERAMVLLERVISEKPDTVSPYLMLAYAQVRISDIVAAQLTLDAVPENLAKLPEVASLKGRLVFTSSLIGAPKFAELQQRVKDDENDSEAQYFLASFAVVGNDFEQALEILLTLMTQDPEFRDQAPRKTMITIFEILGDHPLATEYRKKMARFLH